MEIQSTFLPSTAPTPQLQRQRAVDQALVDITRQPAPSPEQASQLQTYLNQTQADIDRVRNPLPFPPLPTQPQPADRREAIMEQIKASPRAKQNFEALNPDQQAKFLALCEALPPNPGILGGIMGGLGGSPPQQQNGTDPNLITLLESGKLLDTDPEGHTLLDNLSALSTQKCAQGIDGRQILRDVVLAVANPNSIHQGYKGTCGPTTIEYLHAKNSPADYVRVIAGLCSEEGKVRLRNGEELTRDQGCVAEDNSGRTAASRIYQASMMEFADGDEEYDNATDGHYRYRQQGDLTVPDKTHGGLYTNELQRVMDGVLPYQSEFASPGTGAEQEIRSLVQQGLPVVALIKWVTNPDHTTGNHYLVIESFDDTSVSLRNPWGDGDHGRNGPGDTSPVREVSPGGHIVLSKADFMDRLLAYSRPTTPGKTPDQRFPPNLPPLQFKSTPVPTWF